ncbi:MAG: dTMP kinase [Proteobacteria bacterium]|nr:dTMP kinase [Pseudomonadota bacterium]
MPLITFEGIDASGKTTQLELLSKKLKNSGYDLLITRQPGGTRVGSEIRDILLNPQFKELDSTAEILLYLSDRIQHINELIKPALKQKKIVLCDRYHDATVAYQGGGRQINLNWLEALEKESIMAPDLTFWFDIPVAVSQDRLLVRNRERGIENCRIESEKTEFFQRVHEEYTRLCVENPGRFIRIDAVGKIDAIQDQIYQTIMKFLKNHSGF